MINKWTTVIVVVNLSLLLSACNRAADIDEEKKNVQQVFEKYLESIKTDDVTLASQV